MRASGDAAKQETADEKPPVDRQEPTGGEDEPRKQREKPKPAPKRVRRIVCSLVPLALAIVAAVLSLVFGSPMQGMTARSDEATIDKIVVRNRRDSNGDKEKTIAVSVSFEDGDHVRHTTRSLYEPRKNGLHHEGEPVSVLYDPQNPDSGCVIVGEERLVENPAGRQMGHLARRRVRRGGARMDLHALRGSNPKHIRRQLFEWRPDCGELQVGMLFVTDGRTVYDA